MLQGFARLVRVGHYSDYLRWWAGRIDKCEETWSSLHALIITMRERNDAKTYAKDTFIYISSFRLCPDVLASISRHSVHPSSIYRSPSMALS